jgi:ABC-type uncharacterized transport system auxiliary subunit
MKNHRYDCLALEYDMENVMKKGVFLILLSVMFGCGRSPQIHYYQLYYDLPAAQQLSGEKIVYVPRFRAQAPYNRDQLIFLPSLYQVEFDFYRRWVQPPDLMLTQLFIEQARQSGHFSQVLSEIPADPHWIVEGEIQTFGERIRNGNRIAEFSIFVRIKDSQRSGVHFSQTFAASEPIRGAGADAIVSALSQVTRRVFDAILEKL